jgi:plasmid segregation protein ParM
MEVSRLTGKRLQDFTIETVLQGERGEVSQEIIDIIHKQRKIYIDTLVDALENEELPLKESYVVFLGGAASLIKDDLKWRSDLSKAYFIEDICANAKGYEEIALAALNRK